LKGALVVLGSLVFELSTLSFVFAVCCLLFADKNKTRRQLSLAAGRSRIVCARFGLSAQEHDRQPATSVVVMPMSIVAVTCSNHRCGFIPDEQATCQTLVSFTLIHTAALARCASELRRAETVLTVWSALNG
jgi:hypothetical protein